MNELESLELRIEKLEGEAKELSENLNGITLEQVRSATKLDIVITSLGELKDGLETLKRRPGWFWDKLTLALIAAVCGVLVSYLME